MMNRKQFLRSLAGVGVGVLGATALVGCADGVDASLVDAGDIGVDETPIEGLACSPATEISNNHGHAVVVPAADVVAGVQKQYSIQGTSAHRHFITVTAAMFAQLRANQTVTVRSGGVSHTHVVTISCVLSEPCEPTATISANHGHAVTVPEADIIAGVDKQYSIQGTSTHRHFITVTAAMFTMLRQGTTVSVISGGVTHRHTVTIACAPPPVTCSPSAVISSNHGHALVIPNADVVAGVQRTYDVTGSATHPHQVTVTAAMFASLATNASVTATATGGTHTHGVTITCG